MEPSASVQEEPSTAADTAAAPAAVPAPPPPPLPPLAQAYGLTAAQHATYTAFTQLLASLDPVRQIQLLEDAFQDALEHTGLADYTGVGDGGGGAGGSGGSAVRRRQQAGRLR
jgi:hypothetical protein